MTAVDIRPADEPGRASATERQARTLSVLMCRPEHFEVTYAINPWMHPDQPVDRARALAQWDGLRATYEAHGHRVQLVDDIAGLPDMVFAANAGLVYGDRALVATFAHPERQPESPAFQKWFEAAGYHPVRQAVEVNEGEGDFLRVGKLLLAGTGFRSSPASHAEVTEFFEIPVITLELVDPRFYHLDTALCALDEGNVAYWPGAFSAESRAVLADLFPDAVLATEADACVFGLNAVSDGRHVYLAAAATGLAAALAARGYEPVPVELDELLKGGGSVKCCTLELHDGVGSDEGPA